jgi:hypothetical protein
VRTTFIVTAAFLAGVAVAAAQTMPGGGQREGATMQSPGATGQDRQGPQRDENTGQGQLDQTPARGQRDEKELKRQNRPSQQEGPARSDSN